MAPIMISHTGPTQLTDIGGTTSTGFYTGTDYWHQKPIKKETRQERLDRVSLAKHRASMKVIDQPKPKMISIKQHCKSHHRICY